MGGTKSDFGKRVQRDWNIPAIQTFYHREGDFYMPLTRFPGALADRHGYRVFGTEKEYVSCPYIRHRGSAINPRIGVPRGISNIPGYVLEGVP